MDKQAGGVVFERVTKRYGDATVVDEVSFTVSPGELVTLLGPSGCGKTTTLRMLAGFETIRALAGSPDLIVAGHDPEVATRFETVEPGIVRIA